MLSKSMKTAILSLVSDKLNFLSPRAGRSTGAVALLTDR
jgi:hypothetical protein